MSRARQGQAQHGTARDKNKTRLQLSSPGPHHTMFSWFSSLSSEISRIAVDGTPSSSCSNLWGTRPKT